MDPYQVRIFRESFTLTLKSDPSQSIIYQITPEDFKHGIGDRIIERIFGADPATDCGFAIEMTRNGPALGHIYLPEGIVLDGIRILRYGVDPLTCYIPLGLPATHQIQLGPQMFQLVVEYV